jgi:hypothetical protein
MQTSNLDLKGILSRATTAQILSLGNWAVMKIPWVPHTLRSLTNDVWEGF